MICFECCGVSKRTGSSKAVEAKFVEAQAQAERMQEKKPINWGNESIKRLIVRAEMLAKRITSQKTGYNEGSR